MTVRKVISVFLLLLAGLVILAAIATTNLGLVEKVVLIAIAALLVTAATRVQTGFKAPLES